MQAEGKYNSIGAILIIKVSLMSSQRSNNAFIRNRGL